MGFVSKFIVAFMFTVSNKLIQFMSDDSAVCNSDTSWKQLGIGIGALVFVVINHIMNQFMP